MTGGSGSRMAPSRRTVVRPSRRAVARRAGWALLAVLILAGCSQAPGGPSATPTTESIFKATSVRTGQIYSPPGRGTTKGPIGANPSLAHGLALSILSGLVSDHPIYDGDFADPSALDVSNTLYFYASSSSPSKNDHGANIPVIGLSQGAGFSGQFLGDALPKAPAWSVAGYQWGPDVWARPDKTYVMYYSTPATVPLGCLATPPAKGCVKTFRGLTNAECISRATATNPAGPFVDNSSSAFICPLDEGGAIDPSVFVASNGTPWLLWKSDGDCCDKPTYIYSQQLSPDGLSTVGPPHRLIGATQAWEGDLVEAPAMIEDHNQFWLFYSGNLWGHETYGIGIAHCASVTGPCTKPLDHAWVASDSDGVSDQGPGGEDFHQTGPIIWMVHHGLAPGQSWRLRPAPPLRRSHRLSPRRAPAHRGQRAGGGVGGGCRLLPGSLAAPRSLGRLSQGPAPGRSVGRRQRCVADVVRGFGVHGTREGHARRTDRRFSPAAASHDIRGVPRHHSGRGIPVPLALLGGDEGPRGRAQPAAVDSLTARQGKADWAAAR